MRGRLVFLIPFISLLCAAFVSPLPHWFFTFNRVLVTFFAISGVFYVNSLRLHKKYIKVILVIIAVLFNPIIPFHFAKSTWQIVDVVVNTIFFVLAFAKITYNDY